MVKLIQISIEVWLEKVTAQAADSTPPQELACLEVEMLGKRMRTTDIPLVFPIVFGQRITFKRMYKHATIMRALEHLYHDPMTIKLNRSSGGFQEGVPVARFDGSTGNSLLDDTGAGIGAEDMRADQSLDLRVCVEGFCFRPKLAYSSFVTFREIAASPRRYDANASSAVKRIYVSRSDVNKDEYERQFERIKEDYSENERTKASDNPQSMADDEALLQQSTDGPLNSQSPNSKPVSGGAVLTASPTSPASNALYREPDWNEMCERPPFVVRHVDSKLNTRTPKLHKTMSQETNLMLMQYQLDHPSDDSVQKVCPTKVPPRFYKKLRRQYEEKHSDVKQKPKKAPGLKMPCRVKYACEVPLFSLPKSTKVQSSAPAKLLRSVSEEFTSSSKNDARPVEFTIRRTPLPKRSLIKATAEAPIVLPPESPKLSRGNTNIEPAQVYNIADVKKFVKRTDCSSRSQQTDTSVVGHSRPNTGGNYFEYPLDRSQSSSQSCRDVQAFDDSVLADDQELAAVYRDVTRTLQRDTVRRTGEYRK